MADKTLHMHCSIYKTILFILSSLLEENVFSSHIKLSSFPPWVLMDHIIFLLLSLILLISIPFSRITYCIFDTQVFAQLQSTISLFLDFFIYR